MVEIGREDFIKRGQISLIRSHLMTPGAHFTSRTQQAAGVSTFLGTCVPFPFSAQSLQFLRPPAPPPPSCATRPFFSLGVAGAVEAYRLPLIQVEAQVKHTIMSTTMRSAMALRGVYMRGSMLQRRSFATKTSKPSVTVRLAQTIDDMFADGQCSPNSTAASHGQSQRHYCSLYSLTSSCTGRG